MEVQVHWFSIYGDFATARPDVDYSLRVFAFAGAPGPAVLVDLVGPLLFGQHPAEVEQIDPIELHEVVRVQVALAGVEVQSVRILPLCKLRKERPQMMLVERVLLV